MPTGFYGDADGSRYRAAYFEKFPGIWHHGDWVQLEPEGGMTFFGRSDATLNPGGVRIGTAEIYRQVEQVAEVEESVVIGQDLAGDQRILLFVRLKQGLELDQGLRDTIRQAIRQNTTPRHVPARILQVTDIPRTRSGKISELAVKRVVQGQDPGNLEALANPEALAEFANRQELKEGSRE
jgi:acetoacetyl-CoA synthetase